jgi:ribosomal protein S18 acetylase RimI-like enzyme
MILLVIEVAESSDPTGQSLGELAALVDAYRCHFGGAADPTATAEWLATWTGGRRGRGFVARVDGEPAGFALVVTIPATVLLTHAWHLRDLWVEPRHRRGGVARALVERVCAAATEDGASRITLNTEQDNVVALRLYRSLGFAAVTGYRTLALDLQSH